jgi:hypothetical protein
METEGAEKVKKCIIITDSNGKEASEETIKWHIPKEERSAFSIKLVVAYTMEGALGMIGRGGVDIKEAVIVVDCLTNNTRGTRARPRMTPGALAEKLGRLMGMLMRDAEAVVVCEMKPMRHIDITPYNEALHLECMGRERVYGCHTQIRMNNLVGDGFHIRMQCAAVLDRTYAYSLMGIPVPCPSP